MSLAPKIDEVRSVILDANPDLGFFTETWLGENSCENNLQIPGYHFPACNRCNGMLHGGVGLYVKQNIHFSNDEIDALWVWLHPRLPRGVPCVVAGSIYHPQFLDDKFMLEYLSSSLTAIEDWSLIDFGASGEDKSKFLVDSINIGLNLIMPVKQTKIHADDAPDEFQKSPEKEKQMSVTNSTASTRKVAMLSFLCDLAIKKVFEGFEVLIIRNKGDFYQKGNGVDMRNIMGSSYINSLVRYVHKIILGNTTATAHSSWPLYL
ncbi:predicted protein [Nematostella vectensis]|uniref:Uncharacterized protein n=1 Tax=Nematostella vectensis TaxID=45351 RepID=A7SW06_NEMVE|nr:predicted protein [Nematostella vectensis]|eukprot:XP_001624214.1 predicted protein [Nematostella vectensis]